MLDLSIYNYIVVKLLNFKLYSDVHCSRLRWRHRPAAAHAAGLAVLGPLEVAAQLNQEQLPGQPEVPPEEDAR